MEICTKIRDILADCEAIPLYYVEAGSRLWGTDHPASDYDVRGVHLQTTLRYFDYRRQKESIDVKEGLFDFVSFDIDRFFAMLEKSNPSCLEWLRSHILYMHQLPEQEALCEGVFQHYDHHTLFQHYLSLARHNVSLIQSGRKATVKTTLYCIRGLLSANTVSTGRFPPLVLGQLMEETENMKPLLALARECLVRRQEAQGLAELENPEQILEILQGSYDTINSREVPHTGNLAHLQAHLARMACRIKQRVYCHQNTP